MTKNKIARLQAYWELFCDGRSPLEIVLYVVGALIVTPLVLSSIFVSWMLFWSVLMIPLS